MKKRLLERVDEPTVKDPVVTFRADCLPRMAEVPVQANDPAFTLRTAKGLRIRLLPTTEYVPVVTSNLDAF
jgi:hypothetical protein